MPRGPELTCMQKNRAGESSVNMYNYYEGFQERDDYSHDPIYNLL